MSWQSYVDDSLVATGNVRRGAILGLDGSLWAASGDFSISGAEASALAGAAANPDSVLGGKLTVAGVAYMVLRASDESIYLRKGQDGVCVCKTNQAVLVGMYDEKISAGNCNNTVEKLAEYLRENNY